MPVAYGWHPDGSRPLQRSASWWRRAGIGWDPRPATPALPEGPQSCPSLHLSWALSLSLCDLRPHSLPDCLTWCYEKQTLLPDLPGWRRTLLLELKDLVQELQSDECEWLLGAPWHVQQLYSQGSGSPVFPMRVLTELLAWCAFEGAAKLVSDLF